MTALTLTADQQAYAVLEVTVNNHPGVLTHLCSLFSRRAYQVESVLCMPAGNAAERRIWLLMREAHRLEQIERQLLKLEDVRSVRHHGTSHAVFARLEELLG